MAGTLFVVATPIGNLEDLTFRAARILREVPLVAAEDTRRSGHLLRHLGSAASLLSLHEHNEDARAAAVLQRLAKGESVAVVSDAGTPAISDPGARLVAAVVAAGYRVEPVPGPSAVLAALSAAGLDSTWFTFAGFPPVRGKARTTWFESVVKRATLGPVVAFEAPHRVVKTLQELDILLNNRIIVFRELTKLHETRYEGRPREVLEQIDPVAGEFTLVVPRLPAASNAPERPSDDAVKDLFGRITGTSARAAAREVAAATGLSANEVYEIVRRDRN
jgi:16S rRNA (cytidine1402-2'-O)-methyltransferase